MKNQTIRNRFAAIRACSERVLPTKESINKYHCLLLHFDGPYEATQKLMKKEVFEKHPLPEGWVGKDRLPVDVAEARQRATDALMEMSTPVRKVPDQLRIRSADLPKTLTKEGGEDNAISLANIKFMLGSLYIPDEAEKELRKPVEGYEADEDAFAEPAVVDEFAPRPGAQAD